MFGEVSISVPLAAMGEVFWGSGQVFLFAWLNSFISSLPLLLLTFKVSSWSPDVDRPLSPALSNSPDSDRVCIRTVSAAFYLKETAGDIFYFSFTYLA